MAHALSSSTKNSLSFMENRPKVRGSTLTAVLLIMSRIANAYMPIHTTPHLPVCQLSQRCARELLPTSRTP
ncbi:hypothetical protein B0O80DRAFT_475237 [Mortierella sp. GBAus27b]|nr:hypothetical protein B0O80DRAFT_475237 [Mortierella sp. GBAus27b]